MCSVRTWKLHAAENREKEAERILRTCNKGSQLILTVEGQKMPVLLKEIDYNAMKHEIVEMDFQALVKGEKVIL